jgi:hypothetical protein
LPEADTIVLKRINANTIETVSKKGGKPVMTTRSGVSSSPRRIRESLINMHGPNKIRLSESPSSSRNKKLAVQNSFWMNVVACPPTRSPAMACAFLFLNRLRKVLSTLGVGRKLARNH